MGNYRVFFTFANCFERGIKQLVNQKKVLIFIEVNRLYLYFLNYT